MKEHCGLFGVYRRKQAARLTYFGLYAQQHRGQEGAGIAVWNGKTITDVRSLGLVHDIFQENHLADVLKGQTAIGHVLYAYQDKPDSSELEPFIVRRNGLQLAIAHNGSLTNRNALRLELEKNGAIFHSQTDSEIFAHLIVKKLNTLPLEKAIIAACSQVQGAYSLIILANDKLIALRDPHGVRPLCIGRLEDSLVIASESCAFDLLEAEYLRSIKPGEMVVISGDSLIQMQSYFLTPTIENNEQSRCLFELIYFARPDSYVFNQNVYLARKQMGMQLAKEFPVEADLVMPFPDSGVYSAVGYAHQSGIPYEHALIRNHYVGRTFIQPSQDMRDFSARVKLNPVREVLKDKRIIIVDDSIVRGTTMRTRVKNLRELGAREVHCRISCPPIKYPCHYGVAFASKSELIAANHNLEDIKRFLSLDSLQFLSLKGLSQSVAPSGYCQACFTGRYPIPINT